MRTMTMIGIACSLFASACAREAQGTCYVGHGLFSDWPHAHLERAYRQFAPQEKPVDLGYVQLD